MPNTPYNIGKPWHAWAITRRCDNPLSKACTEEQLFRHTNGLVTHQVKCLLGFETTFQIHCRGSQGLDRGSSSCVFGELHGESPRSLSRRLSFSLPGHVNLALLSSSFVHLHEPSSRIKQWINYSIISIRIIIWYDSRPGIVAHILGNHRKDYFTRDCLSKCCTMVKTNYYWNDFQTIPWTLICCHAE